MSSYICDKRIMKKEIVEIYSDASNNAVMRHPEREYPGSLVQGDTLHILIQDIKEAKDEVAEGNPQDAVDALAVIIETLEQRLKHYKNVLKEHGSELPFVE